MEEKKMRPLDKEIYKIENGKVYIESEELANAIQQGELDLFIDEEANANGNCFWACSTRD